MKLCVFIEDFGKISFEIVSELVSDRTLCFLFLAFTVSRGVCEKCMGIHEGFRGSNLETRKINCKGIEFNIISQNLISFIIFAS